MKEYLVLLTATINSSNLLRSGRRSDRKVRCFNCIVSTYSSIVYKCTSNEVLAASSLLLDCCGITILLQQCGIHLLKIRYLLTTVIGMGMHHKSTAGATISQFK